MLGYYLLPHPPLIIPEVGKGQEKEIRKTIDSCTAVGKEISESEADTIIIITPHGTLFGDAVSLIETDRIKGNLSRFGAKEVSFDLKINTELTQAIINTAEAENIAAVGLNNENAKAYKVSTDLDHGAAVPLYFVKDINRFTLVHITYGMLSPSELYRFGMLVEKVCASTNAKAVMIASGDLSHRLTHDGPYPFSPYGAQFDNELLEYLKQGDFKGLFKMNRKVVAEAGECGLRSLYILAGALDGKSAKAQVLSYEGPFGVGYGVARFSFSEGTSIYSELKSAGVELHQRRLSEGTAYTKLARKNIENYFKTGESLKASDIQEEVLRNDKKGVFVSLKLGGELRGCIGTIEAVTPSVGEEILNNSISAAFNDPRFSPLREDELYEIDISVDLLYPAEGCKFLDLDPSLYGVIVTSGRKRGLLLPMLEGVDTSEEQVNIALQKAGIRKGEAYEIQRFKVERFKEVEM